MKLLAIPISPKSITELYRLKAKMNGAPLRRITDRPTPNPTSNSTPTPAPEPTPDLPDPAPSPTSNTPQHRPPKRQRDRLRGLFPPGIGSNSKSEKGPYTYPPHQLSDLLDDHPHTEQTVVMSAWYGKQTKSAKHEFIVIHVEDLLIPGLKNCIAIDRNQGKPTSDLAGASSSSDASDTFRVSYDGDLNRLLDESRLTPHMVLERLDFRSGERLLLQKLVNLVYHISERHRRYNPVDTNCYWFTGLIWECIQRLHPGAKHEVPAPGRKGRISFARFIPNPIQVRSVLRAVETGSNKSNPEASSSNDSVDEPEEDTAAREANGAEYLA